MRGARDDGGGGGRRESRAPVLWSQVSGAVRSGPAEHRSEWPLSPERSRAEHSRCKCSCTSPQHPPSKAASLVLCRRDQEARRGAGVGGTLPHGTRNRTQAPRSRRLTAAFVAARLGPPRGGTEAAAVLGDGRCTVGFLARCPVLPTLEVKWTLASRAPHPQVPPIRQLLHWKHSLDSYRITFVTSYSRERTRSWVIVLLFSAGGTGGLCNQLQGKQFK